MSITSGAGRNLGVRHAGQWSRNAALSMANGATTTLSMNVETEDTDGYLTPTSGVITIPAGLGGLYLLNAGVSLAAVTASRGRMAFEFAAGTGTLPAGTPTALRTDMVGESDNSITSLVQLNAGNTVTLNVFHSTGSAINANTAFLSLLLVPQGGVGATGPAGTNGATGPAGPAGPAGTNAVVILTDAAQTITTATHTDITWGTEVSDVDGWTSGGSETLTVPTGKGGLYVISYVGEWSGSVGTLGAIACYINGVPVVQSGSLGATYINSHDITFVRTLAAGDTIKFRCYQDSGANRTITSRLEITPVMGPGATGATGPGATVTAWTAVTFQNSWIDFGSGHNACQYRKIGDQVYVRGKMKSGTVGAATPAILLPVGFRPPATLDKSTVSNSAFGAFNINTDGTMCVSVGNNTWVQVDCDFSVTA